LTVNVIDHTLSPMADEPAWYEELSLSVLLAEARRTYGSAIRRALAAAGFDDMPRAGARVVGGIARHGGTPMREVALMHAVSKQAASQLVDTLVSRGYVVRMPDDEDRRRLSVALTERGVAAAAEIRRAADAVDGALERAIGAGEVARVRAALGTLVELRHDAAEDEE
jgi:DNA-binding MarR family transcriptional regulator